MNPKIYKPSPPSLITELDLRNWDAQPGDLIHISTRGDAAQMKVIVGIRDILGMALELGAAKFDPSIDGWWYVTASQPSLDQILILDAQVDCPMGLVRHPRRLGPRRPAPRQRLCPRRLGHQLRPWAVEKQLTMNTNQAETPMTTNENSPPNPPTTPPVPPPDPAESASPVPPGAPPESALQKMDASFGGTLGQVELLTDAERANLFACETVIETGWQTFVQVGLALAQIRDERLNVARKRVWRSRLNGCPNGCGTKADLREDFGQGQDICSDGSSRVATQTGRFVEEPPAVRLTNKLFNPWAPLIHQRYSRSVSIRR